MLRWLVCLARRGALRGGGADGGRCHVLRLGGRTVRDAFCLWQNATVVGVFGAAVCFAGGVRRTEADGGCGHVQCLGGRTVRDAFCLWQNATGFRQVWRGGGFCWGGAADGGSCYVQRLRCRAVRDAFCLTAKCYEVPVVWRDGADGGGCHVQRLRGVPSATHFALRQNATGYRLSGAAGCFAGAVWRTEGVTTYSV